MRLYVVRHGLARSKAEDPERSLNEQGITETERLATRLKPLGLKVDTIYHSGKARARGTAEIISQVVESANGVKQRDGLNPNDDVHKFAHELDKIDGDTMIAGHLPFVGKIVSLLVTGEADANLVNFEASAMACLKSNDNGRWIILWMVVPGIL